MKNKNPQRPFFNEDLKPNEHFVPIEVVHNLVREWCENNGITITNNISDYYYGGLVGFIVKSDVARNHFDTAVDNINYIEDGFGSRWPRKCPNCQENCMTVVRPGKVQCFNCE